MPAPDFTPRVNCAYGAPLGRRDGRGDPDTAGPFYLRRVPLDSGGYDRGGAYWGHGAPLYGYESRSDPDAQGYLRAKSREDAKRQVREDYPNARFFR